LRIEGSGRGLAAKGYQTAKACRFPDIYELARGVRGF